MNTGSIVFMYPEWLILLPLLIILSLALRYRQKLSNTDVEPANLALVSHISASHLLHPLIHLKPKSFIEVNYSIRQTMMYTLILSFLIVALAEPVRIGQKLPDPPQERDIVFIIDTSVSMSLRDYVLDGQRVDRLSLLKEILDRFIQKLKGERIGLMVFGDEVYTLVPLTRDQQLLRRMLYRIEPGMAGRFNAVGEAVSLAVKQAAKQADRHRVLILLTDASQPTGKINPMTAAQLAKEDGMPLYTIAIGATNYAAEESRNAGLIYHPSDPQLLKTIAEHTGAQSFQANNSQILEQAIRAIEQRETNIREMPARYFQLSLYIWPLSSAIILFFLMQIHHVIRYRR